MIDSNAVPYPFTGGNGLSLDPLYRELRSRPGLTKVQPPYGGWTWLATRHGDVTAILENRSFSRARITGPDEPRVTESPIIPGSLISMDPPEHTRLRRAMAGWFQQRRVEVWRPRITEQVEALLDRLAEQGPPADLMSAYARPLAAGVMAELLGVPEADRSRLYDWSGARRTAMWAMSAKDIAAVGQRLREYLVELIDRRRREPSDDLVSSLLHPQDERHALTDQEVAALAGVVFAGGSDINANRIGGFVFALLTRPDLYRRLHDEPSALPHAIEELLRFTTLGARVRAEIAVEDVQVGDTVVRAGESVMASRCSANRDEAVFEQPDEIDFDRERNDHVAFSRGVHFCTGAALARLELQIAIGALVRRLPTLRLDVPAERVRWGSPALCAPEALPVRW